VGLLSTIKKVGRALDPKSSSSPLGGVTAAIINKVPGGSAVLAGAQAAKDAGLSLRDMQGKPASPGGVPPASAPPASASSRALAFLGEGATQVSLGVVALVLVAVLFLIRRK
jgi:hypothetical protein